MKRSLRDLEKDLLERLDYYGAWKRDDDDDVKEAQAYLVTVRQAMKEIKDLRKQVRLLSQLRPRGSSSWPF